MLLMLHIFIALSSLGFATYLYISPNSAKFKIAYGLVAGTLASGTALVVVTHSPLLSSCMSGLIYLAIVSFGLAAARHKLAAGEANNKTD